MTEKERKFAEEQGLIYPETKRPGEKDDTPTIELYKVESIIVHASKMSRNALIGFVLALAAIFAIVVAIVLIFTTKYNERNEYWQETIKMLISSRPAVTEVQHENTEDLQQLPSS